MQETKTYEWRTVTNIPGSQFGPYEDSHDNEEDAREFASSECEEDDRATVAIQRREVTPWEDVS